jgi:hypothetical protein
MTFGAPTTRASSCSRPALRYPLTVTDLASRYLFACEALSTTKEAYAFPIFEAVFKGVGLPNAIRADDDSNNSSSSLVCELLGNVVPDWAAHESLSRSLTGEADLNARPRPTQLRRSTYPGFPECARAAGPLLSGSSTSWPVSCS